MTSTFSRRQFLRLGAVASTQLLMSRAVGSQELRPKTLNVRAEGYSGIWYANQPVNGPYRYKYSGGLATYTAKHRPFAIHAAAANRTFFCYGAAPAQNPRQLLHAVGVFDHSTATLHPPTVVLDKQTDDAHDNPVLAIDDRGHIWLFSTSHGRARPSFIHRSVRPYDITEFVWVPATLERPDAGVRPFDNFSYAQVWFVPAEGFVMFFTRYGDPVARTIMFAASEDGKHWQRWQRLAAIDEGHYQVAGLHISDGEAGKRPKLATCFNYHPRRLGLNYRSNLYYMESLDGGRSWSAADGTALKLPLTHLENPAIVLETRSQNRNVYLKDLVFDDSGRPLILFVATRGWRPGPEDGPRTWQLARWTGSEWQIEQICESDNAYDMGTLRWWNGAWHLIAPVEPGPQRFNPGGEVVVLRREQHGQWLRRQQLTMGSPFNHNYVRRPLHWHPDFWAFWADGHARQPSPVRLYAASADGHVMRFPERMDGPVCLG